MASRGAKYPFCSTGKADKKQAQILAKDIPLIHNKLSFIYSSFIEIPIPREDLSLSVVTKCRRRQNPCTREFPKTPHKSQQIRKLPYVHSKASLATAEMWAWGRRCHASISQTIKNPREYARRSDRWVLASHKLGNNRLDLVDGKVRNAQLRWLPFFGQYYYGEKWRLAKREAKV